MAVWSSKKSLGHARSDEQWERSMNLLIDNRPDTIPLVNDCEALVINRSSVYWRRGRGDLSDEQKQVCMNTLWEAYFDTSYQSDHNCSRRNS